MTISNLITLAVEQLIVVFMHIARSSKGERSVDLEGLENSSCTYIRCGIIIED